MRYRDYSIGSSSSRSSSQRVLVLFLLVVGIALLVFAGSDNSMASQMRARLMGALQPLLSAVSRPVGFVHGSVARSQSLFSTYEENRRLYAENDVLRQWKAAAMALNAENASLRGLLGYRPVEQVTYVTARVISATSGAFAQGMLLDAGSEAGIANLQPVIDAHGLVGRVVELAPHSARVLLLSDVASRVPVVTSDTRQRAILTGTGNELLRLTFLSADAAINLGERVMTTEEGGLIPGGILVGTVFRHDESGYLVKPLRPLAQAEYVRVVQFTGRPAP